MRIPPIVTALFAVVVISPAPAGQLYAQGGDTVPHAKDTVRTKRDPQPAKPASDTAQSNPRESGKDRGPAPPTTGPTAPPPAPNRKGPKASPTQPPSGAPGVTPPVLPIGTPAPWDDGDPDYG
ncbi:MAG TPA: hypothetical protein VLV45_09715 [Gemmatimonadales bacterium]|nr:hypothetical protein [Gemmatimonadales bacterium]